jgi:hypothetical protein
MKRNAVWIGGLAALAIAGSAQAQEAAGGPAISDDVRANLRQMSASARAHADDGRFLLCNQGYMALYAEMERHNMPRR